MHLGDVVTPGEYRVLADRREFRVVSTVRFRDLSDAYTIAVVDLAATQRGCRIPLLHDAAAWWANKSDRKKWPDIRVVLDGRGGPDLQRFGWGGERYAAMFPAETGNGLSCNPKTSRWRPSWSEMNLSMRAFRGLVDEIASHNGVVQILWIGQSFAWFEAVENGATAAPESALPASGEYSPNAAFWRLERILKAGAFLSPAIWNPPGIAIDSVNWRGAQKLAAFLGGRTFDCTGGMVRCGARIAEAAERLMVLRVSAPPVLRRRGLHPIAISISSLRMGSGSITEELSRPFSTDPKGLTWSSIFEKGESPDKLLRLIPAREATGSCGLNPSPTTVCVALPQTAGEDSLRIFVRPLSAGTIYRSWRFRAKVVRLLPAGYAELDLAEIPARVSVAEILLFDSVERWASLIPVIRAR